MRSLSGERFGGRVGLVALLALLMIAGTPGTSVATDTKTHRSLKDKAGDVRQTKFARRSGEYTKPLLRSADIRRVHLRQLNNREARVRIRFAGRLPKRAQRLVRVHTRTPFMYHPKLSLTVRNHAKRARVTATVKGRGTKVCKPKVRYTKKKRVLTMKLPQRCTWWTVRRIEASALVAPPTWMHYDAWDETRGKAKLHWQWNHDE